MHMIVRVNIAVAIRATIAAWYKNISLRSTA